jgi:hypothetical protein
VGEEQSGPLPGGAVEELRTVHGYCAALLHGRIILRPQGDRTSRRAREVVGEPAALYDGDIGAVR